MPNNTRHVLIIKTEARLTQAIVALFHTFGYQTLTAASVDQVRRHTLARPDVIVLDISALGGDGLQSITNLRKDFYDVPIFATSRQSDISIKIAVLDAGADDFLSKPLDLEEFGARIRAMLRRRLPGLQAPAPVQIGEFEFDVEKRSVTIGPRIIGLSHKEFDLLRIFAQHTDKVLTHRFLASQLWTEKTDIHYVRVYVSQIRSKIETVPANPRYLITHPRAGYLFRSRRLDGGSSSLPPI